MKNNIEIIHSGRWLAPLDNVSNTLQPASYCGFYRWFIRSDVRFPAGLDGQPGADYTLTLLVAAVARTARPKPERESMPQRIYVAKNAVSPTCRVMSQNEFPLTG